MGVEKGRAQAQARTSRSASAASTAATPTASRFCHKVGHGLRVAARRSACRSRGSPRRRRRSRSRARAVVPALAGEVPGPLRVSSGRGRFAFGFAAPEPCGETPRPAAPRAREGLHSRRATFQAAGESAASSPRRAAGERHVTLSASPPGAATQRLAVGGHSVVAGGQRPRRFAASARTRAGLTVCPGSRRAQLHAGGCAGERRVSPPGDCAARAKSALTTPACHSERSCPQQVATGHCLLWLRRSCGIGTANRRPRCSLTPPGRPRIATRRRNHQLRS